MGAKGKMGVGGTVIVLLLSAVFGQDFLSLLDSGGSQSQSASVESTAVDPPRPNQDPDAELVDFVSFVLDDAQAVWRRKFAETGREYRVAKLVLFTGSIDSACGFSTAATGPFYCPGDEKVYIDLSFFRALHDRFGAPGDFAQAYVIAHEIAHHVQVVLGISADVHGRKRRASKVEKNRLSVRQELQADCLAGVWAHSTARRELLERGDVAEGIDAAAAIGDDRLQRQAGGAVNPESWAHGSSAQRVRWFERGMRAGRIDDCDTFAAREL